MKIIYFDHSATTRVKPEVLNEMLPYFSTNYGNPSSAYLLGRKNKKAINIARKRTAAAIGCNEKEIIFTSCGSEADNLAIKGVAKANKEKGNHIITSKIEHPAVLNTCKTLEREGFQVTYLNVDKNGIIDIEELKKSITENTILISIMYANNEIGSIQPIQEISNIAKQNGIIFHTDCVQAVGNIKINVKEQGIDMLSMSAHKFYGPKGVGALYVKEGVNFEKQQDGGHQEMDKRAGTENVAGIVGLGRAIELSNQNLENYARKLTKLKNYFFREIKNNFNNVRINGGIENRLPGNVNISFPNIDGEELLLKLDERNICTSAGSACSTGLKTPSHVLTAIGVEKEYLSGSLRITFGEENSIEDVRYLLNSIREIVPNL